MKDYFTMAWQFLLNNKGVWIAILVALILVWLLWPLFKLIGGFICFVAMVIISYAILQKVAKKYDWKWF